MLEFFETLDDHEWSQRFSDPLPFKRYLLLNFDEHISSKPRNGEPAFHVQYSNQNSRKHCALSFTMVDRDTHATHHKENNLAWPPWPSVPLLNFTLAAVFDAII